VRKRKRMFVRGEKRREGVYLYIVEKGGEASVFTRDAVCGGADRFKKPGAKWLIFGR
jgi:hypothetical protein